MRGQLQSRTNRPIPTSATVHSPHGLPAYPRLCLSKTSIHVEQVSPRLAKNSKHPKPSNKLPPFHLLFSPLSKRLPPHHFSALRISLPPAPVIISEDPSKTALAFVQLISSLIRVRSVFSSVAKFLVLPRNSPALATNVCSLRTLRRFLLILVDEKFSRG